MASGVSVRYIRAELEHDDRRGGIDSILLRVYKYNVPAHLQPFSRGGVSIDVKRYKFGLKDVLSTSPELLLSDCYALYEAWGQYVYVYRHTRMLPFSQSQWIRSKVLKYKGRTLKGVRETLNEQLTAATFV